MTNLKSKPESAWVKPVADYGPIIIFFAAYKMWDLYTATAALILATGIALALSLAVNGRVPLMPIITAAVVGFFGGLTLIFNDATFIKMKPTIVQVLFAAILLGGLVFRKPLLKQVMGTAWPIDPDTPHLYRMPIPEFTPIQVVPFTLALPAGGGIWRPLLTHGRVLRKGFHFSFYNSHFPSGRPPIP